jgi:SPX domain protein involved in polyphosphate accumulation
MGSPLGCRTPVPLPALTLRLLANNNFLCELRWVKDMLGSGMACEVHKFSKFIHGCAVLMQVGGSISAKQR